MTGVIIRRGNLNIYGYREKAMYRQRKMVIYNPKRRTQRNRPG